MSTDQETVGICPTCDAKGPIAHPCPEPVCQRLGICFIPGEYVDCSEGTRPDAMIARMIGKYLLVKTIGAGGFGTVYLALQTPILMKTALKMLHRHDDPDLLERLLARFEGEARALARLNHPNTVRLHDYGQHGGSPFLVMEFVDGGRTLDSELADRANCGERLGSDEAHSILRQVADGLGAAHALNIVHRDIKPENLMLQHVEGTPNFVRIADFGLAKFVDEGTQTSRAMGTPAYMAPEQLLQRDIGPWTDLYALGVIAFELITWKRPFPGRTHQEILSKKLDPRYDPLAQISLPNMPAETESFLRTAVARDTKARFRTTTQFRSALSDAFLALHAQGDVPLARLSGNKQHRIMERAPRHPTRPEAADSLDESQMRIGVGPKDSVRAFRPKSQLAIVTTVVALVIAGILTFALRHCGELESSTEPVPPIPDTLIITGENGFEVKDSTVQPDKHAPIRKTSFKGVYTGDEQGSFSGYVSADGTVVALVYSPTLSTIEALGEVTSGGRFAMHSTGTVKSRYFSIEFTGTLISHPDGKVSGGGEWSSSSGYSGQWRFN
jgi:serine/threonine protein kinase